MKIYFAHSKKFDYKNEYYAPIINSDLEDQNELIFPHNNEEWVNSRDIINECDLFVAEISYSGTGLGIEIGWASAFNKKIVCVHQEGVKVSGSIKAVTSKVYPYTKNNLVEIVKENL